MAETGVERYDQLPSRIGSIDVDSLRYKYNRYKDKLEKMERKLEAAAENYEEEENGDD